MGFRDPVRSAETLDTRDGATDPGVTIDGATATWFDGYGTAGKVELITPPAGGTGGSVYRIKGPDRFTDGAWLDLSEVELPAGGYAPAATVTGPFSVTGDGPWSPYPCTWSTNGSAQPTLGNGSLTATHRRVGRLVAASIRLACGLTTNAGNGGFFFTLPAAAAGDREQWIPCKAFTTDGNSWAGLAWIPAGSTTVRPFFPRSSSTTTLGQAQSANAASPAAGQGIPLVPSNYPFTNGCNVVIGGVYEASTS